MRKGTQKQTKSGLKYIAIKPYLYDRLIELGTMRDTFSDVLSEVMRKAEIKGIIPEYEEHGEETK
jgi:hypothetical protein